RETGWVPPHFDLDVTAVRGSQRELRAVSLRLDARQILHPVDRLRERCRLLFRVGARRHDTDVDAVNADVGSLTVQRSRPRQSKLAGRRSDSRDTSAARVDRLGELFRAARGANVDAVDLEVTVGEFALHFLTFDLVVLAPRQPESAHGRRRDLADRDGLSEVSADLEDGSGERSVEHLES